jgi:hypothetical protein
MRATRWLLFVMALGVCAALCGVQETATWGAVPASFGDLTLTGALTGPRTAVFDTRSEACELIDIPDAPARAYRDDRGTVHVIASHYVARASVGPTLEEVRHDCAVIYRSDRDPNPAHYDDYTWLDSFYSIDGRTVVALGHMEYHGWEHRGMCASRTDTNACWYNADTVHVSRDGGYHFNSARAPADYAVGLPYRYVVNQGPEGYSVDTNIIKVGEWYYAMLTDWPWPPGCGAGQGRRPCLVPFGGSPIRTSSLLEPSSWRGWDGHGFSVVFADPYRDRIARPQDHVAAPVPYMYYVNALNVHEGPSVFIATLWDPWNDAYGPPGLYLSTSSDLVRWSKPTGVVTLAQLRAREPRGNWSYLYFSLIDPNSPDPNFSTVTDAPYLYYVRMDDNHGPYTRVLFRQRITLRWR